MKRTSILVLLLALFSAAVLTGVSIAVQWKGSSVTVEAETLAGDQAAAEGLELSLPVYCQNAMLWKLTVPAARPGDTDSRFDFSSLGLRNAQFNLLNLTSPYPMVRSSTEHRTFWTLGSPWAAALTGMRPSSWWPTRPPPGRPAPGRSVLRRSMMPGP